MTICWLKHGTSFNYKLPSRWPSRSSESSCAKPCNALLLIAFVWFCRLFCSKSKCNDDNLSWLMIVDLDMLGAYLWTFWLENLPLVAAEQCVTVEDVRNTGHYKKLQYASDLQEETWQQGIEQLPFYTNLSKPQLTVFDRVKASSSILSSKLRSSLTSPGNFLYLLKTSSAILLLIYCGLCLFVFTAPCFWGYMSCLFLHSICSWWDLK